LIGPADDLPRGATMRLRVGCELVFASDMPVATVMLVRVRPDDRHWLVGESATTAPETPLREYVDGFGNRCWRLTTPTGPLSLRYDATVDVERAADPVVSEAALAAPWELPDDALVFTLPSRQVESDLLLADAWRLFGDAPPSWARVQAVCDWIHANVRYDPTASGPASLGSAVGVYQRRVGVCRDFALLAVAFCRALNIPARYVFGYLPDVGVAPPETPMDFHAWFEALVGGRWYAFDARHNTPRAGRVPVGRGRDAVDVALTTAYGAAVLTGIVVWADEVLEDAPGGMAARADGWPAPAGDGRR
jgi:transglutaminase-like putative cysteine protease